MAGAGLATGSAERWPAATSTNPRGAPLRVAPPVGFVFRLPVPCFHHGAGSAQGRALERRDGTACTKPCGSAVEIRGPIGRPAFLETGRAARSALNRLVGAAAHAKPRVQTCKAALPASPAGLPAFSDGVVTAIRPALGARPAVARAVCASPALAAGCAQAPVGLVRVEAAPATHALGHTCLGPLAGAPVFGLPGLGIPDAFNAGVTAPGGSAATRSTALLETDRALAAAGIRSVPSTPWAEPPRTAVLGTPAMALTVPGTSLVVIAVRHGGCLPDRWMDGIGGPAGTGGRTRCAPTGETAVGAESDPRWHGTRSTARPSGPRAPCR